MIGAILVTSTGDRIAVSIGHCIYCALLSVDPHFRVGHSMSSILSCYPRLFASLVPQGEDEEQNCDRCSDEGAEYREDLCGNRQSLKAIQGTC